MIIAIVGIYFIRSTFQEKALPVLEELVGATPAGRGRGRVNLPLAELYCTQ